MKKSKRPKIEKKSQKYKPDAMSREDTKVKKSENREKKLKGLIHTYFFQMQLKVLTSYGLKDCLIDLKTLLKLKVK